MELKFLFTSLCVVLGLNTSIWAQTNDLTREDIEAFRERAGETINTFQKNLEIIGSKEQSLKVKTHYRKGVLKLFMGEGNPYTDVKGNMQEAVKMQVSSKNSKSIKTLTLKEYLTNLVKLTFARVEITKADTYRISNFYKIGEQYVATATIFQRFCGHLSDGRGKYCDETQKSITVYITPEKDGVLGDYWSVKLGDVEVVETKSTR